VRRVGEEGKISMPSPSLGEQKEESSKKVSKREERKENRKSEE